MPLVREYSADANVAGPIDTRQARAADTGEIGLSLEHLGNAVSDVGQAVHHRQAQSEISDVTAKLARARSGLTNELNSQNTPDENFSENFMQRYDDAVEDIGSGIQTPEGQKYFQTMNAHMRSQFHVNSMGVQAKLAGDQAVNDHADMMNNLSSSLVGSPSQFADVNDMAGMALQAKVDSGAIDAGTAGKIRRMDQTKLAEAALHGYMEQGQPEVAKASLESGHWDQYLDGEKKFELTHQADTWIKAKDIDAKRAQKESDDKLAEAQEKTMDANLGKLYDNGLSTDEVLKDPVLNYSQKKEMLGMIDRVADGKSKDDPGLFNSVAQRIYLPDGAPGKITNPDEINHLVGNGLTPQSAQMFRNQIKKTPEGQREQSLKADFLNSVKKTMVNDKFMADPTGNQQYHAWLSDFLPAYDKARSQGIPAAELLSPSSKNYMGKTVDAYMRSTQDKINSMVNRPSFTSFQKTDEYQGAPLAPGSSGNPPAGAPSQQSRVAPEPRQKGESAADYLKRTGKH